MTTRTRGLLLGPAAFCLLAGVLGLGLSAYCLSFSHKDDVNAGHIGLLGAVGLLAAGGLFLTAAYARCPARKELVPVFVRWVVVAAVMVIPTAVLFGPTGGFHHHIGFGPIPFFYMVWNGEDPGPGSFQIVDGYEVWFNPWLSCALLGVWAVIATVVIGIVRPVRENARNA